MDSIETPGRAIRKLALFAGLALIVLIFLPAWGVFQYGERIFKESQDILARQRALAARDCGVVLTGGSYRIREGVVLLSRHRIGRLIISGVNPKSALQEIYPDIVFYPEIPLDRVILERTSGSTASNAQHTQVIAEALGCRSLLLITSDYHMVRALATFKSIFGTQFQIEPWVVSTENAGVGAWFKGIKNWGLAAEEFLKYLFYEATVF